MSDGTLYVATSDGEYKPLGKVSEIQISEAEHDDGDPIVFDKNEVFEFEADCDASALMAIVRMIVNLNTNNWRKLHGLRMLHHNRTLKRRQR